MCQSLVIKICRVGETLKLIQVKLSEQEVFSICSVALKFGSSLKESRVEDGLFWTILLQSQNLESNKTRCKVESCDMFGVQRCKTSIFNHHHQLKNVLFNSMFIYVLCLWRLVIYCKIHVIIWYYLRNHSTIAGSGDWSNFDLSQPARSFVYFTAPSAGSLCCNEFGQLCTGPKRQFGKWILQNYLKLTLTQVTWSVLGFMTTSGIKLKTPTDARTSY